MRQAAGSREIAFMCHQGHDASTGSSCLFSRSSEMDTLRSREVAALCGRIGQQAHSVIRTLTNAYCGFSKRVWEFPGVPFTVSVIVGVNESATNITNERERDPADRKCDQQSLRTIPSVPVEKLF